MSPLTPSKTTFVLRIASAIPMTADAAAAAQPTDRMAAYRDSRMAARQSLSAMRGMSIGLRPTGATSYYRRAI